MDRDANRSWILPRFGVRTLLAAVTLCAIGLFGYQKWVEYEDLKTARQWVESLDNGGLIGSPCPKKTTLKHELRILRSGALSLENPTQRTKCLKILAEQYPDNCLDTVLAVALGSRDIDNQLTAIRILSILREPSVLPQLDSLASHPDPRIRAARIDCIGMTRVPSYEKVSSDAQVRYPYVSISKIKSNPPIMIGPIMKKDFFSVSAYFVNAPVNQSHEGSGFALKEDFPERYRTYLTEAMLADTSSPEERSAASRAIVAWPPSNYEFRYAEWGVWMNINGQFRLVDSIIDEIPDFVHRTGNDLDSFKDRLTAPMIVTKPVIHLSANKTMAVDLEVGFNFGRPWFAFPKPDDITVHTYAWGNRPPKSVLDDFEGQVNPLNSLREGYPWLLPPSRRHAAASSESKNICSLGLRWQSVIVSPTKLAWMNPPSVDADPKFNWWNDLRDVECSWISHQGDSERFLYYDGPTRARSPLHLYTEESRLGFLKQPLFEEELETSLNFETVNETFLGSELTNEASLQAYMSSWTQRDIAWREISRIQPKRDVFFFEVDQTGLHGAKLDLDAQPEFDLTKLSMLGAEELKNKLLDSLIDAGLNDHEANGLLKCWTPAFFESQGKRVVFLLHRHEYDLMCPMSIRPKPTTTARVGLVLTELD